ncbi:3'-5' exonuclease [Cellulophaga sp. L1A9]|uniref:3'-5' exonuclease n=1 Tax=Cellulophaga sp. L1A9 TaxID=2686362 RepID=UPI00131AF5F3|nr:3'-5' exonuclease [Cellulophaga sp. L1A9]
MQWMIEEARLGPEQRDIIEEMNDLNGKPVWIQGHAGSGKSIVLLHALTDYIIRNPNAKIVVVVFTHALIDLLSSGLRQIPALNGRTIPVITIYDINGRLYRKERFDAIFCDEIQDIPTVLLERIKKGCNQLIIAGDAAQSIYSSVPNFNERPATKEEIIQQLNPEVKNTTTIYRLTRTLISVLKNVYTDLFADMVHIGREDSEIRLFKTDSYHKEIEFSWKESKQINIDRPGEVNAVLFYKRIDIIKYVDTVLALEGKKKWSTGTYPDYDDESRNYTEMNNHLNSQNVPLMYVGSKIGSLEKADSTNKIVIMTYHSSKGLDFDAVSLPNIQTDLSTSDNENALILVALSRAKRDLFITFTNTMYSGYSRFLLNTPVKLINDSKNDNDDVVF